MARRLVALGTVSAAILILVASLGCTQDSRVTSGSATVAIVSSVVSPPPARWDTARFFLSRACARALDSDWGGNDGQCGLDLIANAVAMDLRSQSTEVFFETPLPAGSYRLESLFWVAPTLEDPDASASAPTCLEKISVIPPPLTTGIQVFPSATFLDPPIDFTVAPGETARITVEVNATGLVADYESRWTCVDTPNSLCHLEPSPCLFSFDSGGFGAAIPQFVTVTVE